METMNLNLESLREWIGKTGSYTEQVTLSPIAALAATLDRDDPSPRTGDPLPPLWNWLYFHPIHRLSEAGPDGHSTRGSFLPPVPLPRRMYAGGRLQFHHPLRAGEVVRRVSRIEDVSHKEGRTGPLVFLKVRHETSNLLGVAIVDDQELVYRASPSPGDPAPAPQAAPTDANWSREIIPDPVLLFRYSALTFNSHRIHYDWRYATHVEGYPGLVVHGPLIATLLVDVLRRNLPDVVVKTFSFRAVRPLFDTAPFRTNGRVEADGKTVKLWASDPQGWLAMDATATLA
jgi:3-methylfumaryl-CoA hydratase